MLFKKKTDTPDMPSASGGEILDIQWGGYYASKEESMFRVFCLLDFNKDAYHAQLFQEKFDHLPSFDEVKDLRPSIWHAPVAVGSLLGRGVALIGHHDLDEQSLMGYAEYMRQMGAEEDAIKAMTHQLIAYSHEAPMKFRLSPSASGTVVEPVQ